MVAKDRLSVRLPKALVKRADTYAKDNPEGLSKRSDVAAQALREFFDRRDEQERRRQLFESWAAAGRKWPPPPGLVESQA